MQKLYVTLNNDSKIIYASLDKNKLIEYTINYLRKILKREPLDTDYKIVEEILI